MIRSMTAFARRERQGEWGTIALELRSVNHRYLEVAFRAPEELRRQEPRIRERIGAQLSRGKVDCNVRYHAPTELPGELEVNRDLAGKLAHASREVDGLLYNPAPISSLEVLRWPGVLEVPTPDPDQLGRELLATLDEALEELRQTREREGGQLREFVLQRCAGMEETAARVRQRLPEVLEGRHERLRQRFNELKAEVDPERLEQEFAVLVQKSDVDEELDRLDAHLAEVRRVLDGDQPVGRRLDFLMQELNREANTLSSKSPDTEITQAAVELKVLIEQAREQVQNIE